MKEDEVKELTARDIVQLHCKSSLMNFTKYFFRKQYNRNFVVGPHHELICQKLDAVIRGEITRLIINIAPRYGKTELAVKAFIAYGLALDPTAKFIHLSYSDDLALDNSEAVRDLVQTEYYQDVFPYVEIKHGSNGKKKWYTKDNGGVYATAAGGQVTGFGAGQVDRVEGSEMSNEDADLSEMMPTNKDGIFGGALIIDDPIKPDDADSETVRKKVNNRFDSTIVNRVNSRNTPIIIIMQRLHEDDLCGHVLENYPGEWEVLSLPCIIMEEGQTMQEGKALWEFKHTLNELLKMNNINPINFGRQYMQNPQPREGLLYSQFRTYSVIPAAQRAMRKAYIDTADEGKDYLCSIAYVETEISMYVIDVYYTQSAMETTEPETAKQVAVQQLDFVRVESNNGGRGFARNVEAQVRILGNHTTKFEWFHQSDNKIVRIFTNSAKVNNLIYMPEGWEHRWPLFYKHVTTYSAKGKNANDDAEDCLTGMVEHFGQDFGQLTKSILSMFG